MDLVDAIHEELKKHRPEVGAFGCGLRVCSKPGCRWESVESAYWPRYLEHLSVIAANMAGEHAVERKRFKCAPPRED